jgi:hypothetical protein
MAQIFHPAMNTVARASIFGAIFFVCAVAWVAAEIYTSPYFTEVNETREQPVPFSHEHHVNGLGIDCRYCHTSVETSSFAGIPPTHTCMSCHSQIWTNAAMLEPVRASFREDRPLAWTRVHDLPDYVYFNHSIHVAKGIGCSTCHGPVNHMPLMWKHATLHMQWCLQCHRNPEQYIRPKEEVFNMDWPPADWNQKEKGPQLVEAYHVNKGQLDNCSVCHR